MRGPFILKSVLAFSGVALLGFGIFGLDLAKSLAVAIGSGIIVPVVWLYVRGIRTGDQMLAYQKRNVDYPLPMSFTEAVLVKALENGKVGKKVRISFEDGRMGEAVIETYAGLITPPRVRVIESESPEEE